MGLAAHPGLITSIAASYDGKYIFSSGGADLSVNMWAVDTTTLNQTRNTSTNESSDGTHNYNLGNIPEEEEEGDGYSPTSPWITVETYLPLLEGGEGGELHNDLIDYFYYCQLRAQGEEAMESRSITGRYRMLTTLTVKTAGNIC
jgi:hypothetical protein